MQPTLTKEILFQTILIAQNTIKQANIKRMHRNDVSAINNFLMKASRGPSRVKLKFRDCEKIINIARMYS